MGKTVFTLLFLVISLFVVIKIKNFIKNNPPVHNGPISGTSTIPTDIPQNPSSTSVVILGLNQTYNISDTSITINAVTEDSRCPLNVQCIQAGRVRANMSITNPLGTSTLEIEPNKSIMSDKLIIILTEVTPYPSTSQNIFPEEYRFVLSITNK